MPSLSLSHTFQILHRVWPIIVANASVPLLGLADAAVMGRSGSTAELAGLAVANLIFNLLYWSCGFLRMATTGFVAQAAGRGDDARIQSLCLRMAVIASSIGIALVAAQMVIGPVVFGVLQASAEVENQAYVYFRIRIWGAPAALLLYVVMGRLIGLGHSRSLLAIQVALNLTNILLDVLLVTVADMGLAGVALGTLVTEWLFAAGAVAIFVRSVRCARGSWSPFGNAFSSTAITGIFSANRDLFIRTLCLLLGFGWFLQRSAGFGDTTLAANHLLLAIISFCAFFLDGFAYVAEADVGRASGAGNRQAFQQSVRTTSVCAIICAVILAGSVLMFGGTVISWLTTIETVRVTATDLLPWACLYITVSAVAFQLDGIFIGAIEHRALRDASIGALTVFLLLSFALAGLLADGLWLAFVGYVAARAAGLLAFYPALLRRLE